MPLRIGGVPEHFSIPITNALAQVEAELGDAVTWTPFPGGTGAMCAALADNSIDVAFLLTEGAVKFAQDEPSKLKIVGEFVASPLQWGVHVGAHSPLTALTSPDACRFAISRFGSGSHLMAYVLAQNLGWDLGALRFHAVGGLKGAEEALAATGDLVFLWEKAMTNPLVTRGVFRRIDVCPTPWPCFVVACRPQVDVRAVARMLACVKQSCHEFKARPAEAVDLVVAKFGLDRASAQEWFADVRYSCELGFDPAVEAGVVRRLREVGMLPKQPKPQL